MENSNIIEKRLRKNTVASLIHQVTAVICGFIVPRLIMISFGSDTNGLVNSIAQFLHVISFLELGVGAVVQSSLYKPLANNDTDRISKIVASAERFFRVLACVLLVYIAFLVASFNHISANPKYDWTYTATLIIAMSISSFAQYYFGMVDKLLLTAAQKGYLHYNAQTVTLILNALSCVILVRVGASIQTVKLISSIVFLMRPLFLRVYVNNTYKINRRIRYEGEPIDQKWNGVAQHIAFVTMDSTDVVVLTLMSTMQSVSIYSVYHLVVYGVKQVFLSLTNGIQPVLGAYWAKKDIARLESFFSHVEWLMHTGVVFLFGCAGVLILPFVQVYTAGVNDANYIQPLFSMIILLAHGSHCLRMPYNMMIFAAGRYKQTQHNYFLAAFINVFVTVVAVRCWGLVGAAMGTLISMLFQTVWMAWYNSREIMKRPMKHFVKQFSVDLATMLILWLAPIQFELQSVDYLAWVILAIKYVILFVPIILFVNLVFYRNQVFFFAKKVFRRL